MIVNSVQAIILAAGKSKRFNTDSSKLLERICGKEMILHTTALLEKMHIPTTLVVGFQKERLEQVIRSHHTDTDFTFVTQTEQLGTGHALKCTQPVWAHDHLLVINGDAPLITQAILDDLIEKHIASKAAMSFITAYNGDPSIRGYGLVVTNGTSVKIVEDRHYDGDQRETLPINGGMYLFKRSFLQTTIDHLPRNPISGEYYLTTLAEVACSQGLVVTTVDVPFDNVRGVNTMRELWVAEHIKSSEIIDFWMRQGVRFSGAHSVHVDGDVTIGRGSYVGSSAQLLGKTIIGKNVIIGPFCVLRDAHIADNCILHSHIAIDNSVIGANQMIEPFAYIRNQQQAQRYTQAARVDTDAPIL